MRILIEFFLQDLSRMLPSVNNNIQHFLKRINMKRLFTWFILIVSIVFLVSSCGSDSNVDLRNLDDDDDDDDEITTESIETDTTTTPGASWAQQAYIKAVNSNVSDNFGRSISIDGDILAVGAYLEDSSETTVTNGTTGSSNNDKSASGAVYVFTRNGAGIWAQDAYIKASNSEADDNFGDFVSIDAETLAVGVKLEDSNQTTITNSTSASSNNDNSSSGAVYVYE